jgi:hypothetical protein
MDASAVNGVFRGHHCRLQTHGTTPYLPLFNERSGRVNNTPQIHNHSAALSKPTPAHPMASLPCAAPSLRTRATRVCESGQCAFRHHDTYEREARCTRTHTTTVNSTPPLCPLHSLRSAVLIRLSTVRSPQSAHCLTGMKFGELVEITEENGDWCAPRLPLSHSLFEAFCVGCFAHHLTVV